MSRNRSPFNPMDEVHMIGKLADLKEEHYKHSLLLSAITELLIEKGILTAEELQARAARLDLYGCLNALSGQIHS
jgi:5-carboxymethyl-2-hydroxymuconate isomerase